MERAEQKSMSVRTHARWVEQIERKGQPWNKHGDYPCPEYDPDPKTETKARRTEKQNQENSYESMI